MTNKQFLTLIGVASVCIAAIVAIAGCVKFVVKGVLDCGCECDCKFDED